jgi:cell wall-associated NlpC family hydrolase
MRDFDITLNRSSRAQSKNGYAVARSDLRMGDLVFFDTNGGANRGNISHVGIYIENGQFIHSSSASKGSGVTISSLNESYYNRNYGFIL